MQRKLFKQTFWNQLYFALKSAPSIQIHSTWFQPLDVLEKCANYIKSGERKEHSREHYSLRPNPRQPNLILHIKIFLRLTEFVLHISGRGEKWELYPIRWPVVWWNNSPPNFSKELHWAGPDKTHDMGPKLSQLFFSHICGFSLDKSPSPLWHKASPMWLTKLGKIKYSLAMCRQQSVLSSCSLVLFRTAKQSNKLQLFTSSFIYCLLEKATAVLKCQDVCCY